MIRLLLVLVSTFLLNTSVAFAIGGDGATCNPSTENWPNCSLAEVPARAYVTGTINIPAGNYETPYVASTPNREYILQGDIKANSTGITVTASYVVINLNGHTITYNQTSPGEGVNSGKYNLQYVAVVNGSIIQGAAMSEGDSSGLGNNPVTTYNTALGGNRSVNHMQTANLYVRYGGRDVGGLQVFGDYGLHEQNSVEDIYEFGTLKNRHAGIDALSTGPWGAYGVIRNNTIINARQRGIKVQKNAEVYGNRITLRSISTNSMGIFGYKATDIVVHNNTIIARGEHPIGIGFVSDGTNNIEIYNNYIDAKTTALGDEYGGSPRCFDSDTPCGNYAVGFRSSWGGNNVQFYNNEIYIATDSRYNGTYSPTGESVIVNGKGRGLMVAINAGETATFTNNIISVLDKDGTGKAFGIACTGDPPNESDAIFFIANTVTSNIANIVLSDEYGTCRGYPLFVNNHLIKVDNYSTYVTISNQIGGYFDTTGRFVSNTYSGGASAESINFYPSGRGIVSVYFGTIVDSEYLYSYRYHDNNGTSSVLLRDNYNPAIKLGYAVPGGQPPSLPASPAAPINLRVSSP